MPAPAPWANTRQALAAFGRVAIAATAPPPVTSMAREVTAVIRAARSLLAGNFARLLALGARGRLLLRLLRLLCLGHCWRRRAAQLRDDGGVLQCGDVLRDFLAPGERPQPPAHDFSGARLRQHLGETDVIGPGNGAELLGDPLAQLVGELRHLLVPASPAATHDVGEDRLALDVMRA